MYECIWCYSRCICMHCKGSWFHVIQEQLLVFLFHILNIQMSHWQCPFKGWVLHFCKHHHCWPHLRRTSIMNNYYTRFCNIISSPIKGIKLLKFHPRDQFLPLTIKAFSWRSLVVCINKPIIFYRFMPTMCGGNERPRMSIPPFDHYHFIKQNYFSKVKNLYYFMFNS